MKPNYNQTWVCYHRKNMVVWVLCNGVNMCWLAKQRLLIGYGKLLKLHKNTRRQLKSTMRISGIEWIWLRVWNLHEWFTNRSAVIAYPRLLPLTRIHRSTDPPIYRYTTLPIRQSTNLLFRSSEEDSMAGDINAVSCCTTPTSRLCIVQIQQVWNSDLSFD